MRISTFLALLVSAVWATTGSAAHPVQQRGGARVDVDRGGVHVATGAQVQTDTPVVRARDMIGVAVMNDQNEHLGKIEDLVMDPVSGRIRYAVLSFGGFLGVGDKLFAVPWDDLKLISKGTTSRGTIKEDHYVLNVNKDALKNAPGFDKKQWPDFANREWANEIDKFYSGERAAARSGIRR
jgi:sporulation protein YlmC with PRC-barrel domain